MIFDDEEPDAIEVDERGRAWFWARPGEVKAVLDTIPDEVLVEQYERAWSGSKRPRLAARTIRTRLTQAHLAAEKLESRHSDLTIVQAAPLLDLTTRVLGYRIEQGEYGDSVIQLADGKKGLRFVAGARRRLLFLSRLRPDPRSHETERPRHETPPVRQPGRAR